MALSNGKSRKLCRRSYWPKEGGWRLIATALRHD
jgi:hypothetical protein